jgi:hypothetical protein
MLSDTQPQMTSADHDVGSRQAEKQDDTDRGLRQEEEYNIYYKLLSLCGTQQEFRKRVEAQRFGAISLLRQGRKDVFVEAMQRFEQMGEWDAIYHLASAALSLDDPDGKPSLMASDSRVWKAFIIAAGKQGDARQ